MTINEINGPKPIILGEMRGNIIGITHGDKYKHLQKSKDKSGTKPKKDGYWSNLKPRIELSPNDVEFLYECYVVQAYKYTKNMCKDRLAEIYDFILSHLDDEQMKYNLIECKFEVLKK